MRKCLFFFIGSLINFVNLSAQVAQPSGTCPAMSVLVHPQPQQKCDSNSAFFIAGCNFDPGYKVWQESVDAGITWNDIAGTQGFNHPLGLDSLIFASVNTSMNNKEYRCKFYDGCAHTAYTNPALLTVNPKPSLGLDTSINLFCQNCTADISTLYNTTGYTNTWNTADPSHVLPGSYRLIATNSFGCSDTAFVFVVHVDSSGVQVTTGGNCNIGTAITGNNFQWQADTGFGFVNMNNDNVYSGVNTASLRLTNIPAAYTGNKYRCLINGTDYSDTTLLRITAYWNGSNNSAWENVSNWGSGKVPDSYTDVFLTSGLPVYPEINFSTSCRSIHISNGANLKVKAGINFIITTP
ncbi:MAG: hypothetical protein ABJA78_13860 [Ferruginibacter sp.]